jgi:hypothetical protein
MYKSNPIGEQRRVFDVVGDRKTWWRKRLGRRGRAGCMERPQSIRGRAIAPEDDFVVESYGNGVSSECGCAAMVAKLSN